MPAEDAGSPAPPPPPAAETPSTPVVKAGGGTSQKISDALDSAAGDVRRALTGDGPDTAGADGADEAAGSGVTEASEPAVGLIRDLQDISFLHIFSILLGAWLAIVLVRRLLQIGRAHV